ncbi:hypothetical protein KUTeg_022697 [Tegillarca granosa]|uniref:Protein quiver n=1 Tax=Tegillarca granosa TaxID=220873 RepID=A0ABQ9E435_TEGGR|nr:hypothetical protein KUTeg_022697 [Tegillarca granosa]
MCHQCNSAMGGCGEEVDWRMFPWRDCKDSKFCIKIIKKDALSECLNFYYDLSLCYLISHSIKLVLPELTRTECETTLLKSTRDRLSMPVLRRHGYCSPGRKNDPTSPLTVEDPKVTYCFCNDWNGCNSANGLFTRIAPLTFLSFIMPIFWTTFQS